MITPPRTDRTVQYRHLLRKTEGLPEPLYNVPVACYRADVYFPDHKLVIEPDSRHFHLTPRTFRIEDVLALTIKQPRA